MIFLGWSTMTGDAWYTIRIIGEAFWPPNGGNRSFYSDPEVERIWEESQTAPSLEARNALYAEMSMIAHEQVGYIPLFDVAEFAVAHSYVHGVGFEPAQTIWPLRDVWLDK